MGSGTLKAALRDTGTRLGYFWNLAPSFLLVLLIVVPPFGGTIALYRIALFLFIAHSAVSFALDRRRLDASLKLVLWLGAAFTAWSLLSAIYGVDPSYSRSKWLPEHLYVFLLFSAISLNPHRYRLKMILWAGIVSTCLIALGILLDPVAQGKFIWPKKTNIQGIKAAYIRGFSSDITWITSHLVLVYWLGLTAVLQSSPRKALFYGGLVCAAAGLWIVSQTFQVMAFFVIFVSTLVFAGVWFCKRYGRRGVWGLAVLALLMAGGIAYRDLVLHPQKKTFHGVVELLTTGRTSNAHIQARLNGIEWAVVKCGERPLLGWGPGREILRKVEPSHFNITDEEAAKNPDRQMPVGHLHNQWADLLVRVGIVGLGCYLLFLAAVYRRAILARPWADDWKKHPGAALQLGALIGMTFALVRLLTETYPASSVAVQYWMLLAFVALPAAAWDNSPLFVRNSSSPPR